MIVQTCDYVQRQKKKYLKHTFIWGLVVAVIFGLGLILAGKRENYLTVIAGVLVLGIALNLSRYIGFRKFQDGKLSYAKILEGMKGSYHLFHSGIIPDTRGTAFFDHIIVTSRSIYFISQDHEMMKKYRLTLENKLMSKGVPMKAISFNEVETEVQVKNLAVKIEKDACYSSEKLEEYTRIINDLLM